MLRTFVSIFPIIGLAGCCQFFGVDCAPSSVGNIVDGLRYSEKIPPSTFGGPGSVVLIRSRSPFLADTMCASSEALGASYRPDQSTTTQSNWSQNSSTNSEINLSPNEIQGINAKLSATTKAVESIQLQFVNTSAEEVKDTSVIHAATNNLVATDCLTAIQDRINNGDDVTMIRGALKGSIKYAIEFSSKISTQDQISYKNAISANLGVGLQVNGQGDVTGTDLYWGELDDRFLIQELLNNVAQKNNDNQAAYAKLNNTIQEKGRQAIPVATLVVVNPPP